MTPNEQQQYRLAFKRFQQRRELLWAGKIKKAIEQQVKQFTDEYYFTRSTYSLNAIQPQPLVEVLRLLYADCAKWGNVVYNDLTKQLRTQKVRMPIGMSEAFIAEILRYFNVDLLNDVQNIDETTRNNILAALKIATEKGLGIDDTIALINDTAITYNIARVIARTETVTAANVAASMAADKTKIRLNKIWIAATDNRTRHDHIQVNGTTIPKEQSFIVGGFHMKQPGDRGSSAMRTPAKEIVNCRCSVGFIPQRDSTGRIILL